MKLESIEAIAIRVPRLESAFVKIEADTGLTGWGEIHAPRASEAMCDIVHSLLMPVLQGADFQGSPHEIALFRERLVSTAGSMAEAISGVELALWDLAGKARAVPVARLIAGDRARSEVPAYVTGLSAKDLQATVNSCRSLHGTGFRYFEIDYDCVPDGLISTLDALRDALGGLAGVAVNAHRRLDSETAAEVGQRGVLWLKNPLPADDVAGYAQLAKTIRRRIAVSENCHGHYEAAALFNEKAFGMVQPRLCGCGLTEALQIAQMAADHDVKVATCVEASLGPQLAGAIHFAAALPAGTLVEYDPVVVACVQKLIGASPVRGGKYPVSQLPGLGIEIDEPELRLMEERSR
jgi:D-galactarolactone cycloisomerase